MQCRSRVLNFENTCSRERKSTDMSILRQVCAADYSPLGENRVTSGGCRSSSDVGLSAARFGQRCSPKNDHWCVISGKMRSTPTVYNAQPTRPHRPTDGHDTVPATVTIHKRNSPWKRKSIIAPRSPVPAKRHTHSWWPCEKPSARIHPRQTPRTVPVDRLSMGPRDEHLRGPRTTRPLLLQYPRVLEHWYVFTCGMDSYWRERGHVITVANVNVRPRDVASYFAL